MPRELVVMNWCDPCFKAGEHNNGEAYVVRVGYRKADKAKELVLCERHYKELLLPLVEEMKGAPVFADESASAPMQPTIPGLPAGVSPGRAGIDKPNKVKHLAKTPNRNAPEGFMGRVYPESEFPDDLPHPTTEGDLQTWSCPVCNTPETVWTNKDRARPIQSLRRHMQEMHPEKFDKPVAKSNLNVGKKKAASAR